MGIYDGWNKKIRGTEPVANQQFYKSKICNDVPSFSEHAAQHADVQNRGPLVVNATTKEGWSRKMMEELEIGASALNFATRCRVTGPSIRFVLIPFRPSPTSEPRLIHSQPCIAPSLTQPGQGSHAGRLFDWPQPSPASPSDQLQPAHRCTLLMHGMFKT